MSQDLLARPFPKIIDEFGSWEPWRQQMGLGRHRGADWDGRGGQLIPASGVGVCTWEAWNRYLGWCAVVRYATAFGEIYLGYCHMAYRSHLRFGTWVDRGAPIGYVGNTGESSAGAHLHMTASWTNGDPGTVPVVDPAPFFDWDAALASLDRTPIKTEEQLFEEMIDMNSTELLQRFEKIIDDRVAALLDVRITQAESRLRREARLRLYQHDTTGEMVAVHPAGGSYVGPWNVAEMPGKADSLRVNYRRTDDTPAQAYKLPEQAFANLLKDLGIPRTGGPGFGLCNAGAPLPDDE